MKRFIPILFILLLTLAGFSPLLHQSQEASAVDPIHQYKFHNYADLTYDLHQWEEASPELMELKIIGQSVELRTLWNAHLTNFAENRNKELPEIYLDGGHHGNEQCGSEITILMIQHLLQNYETDPDARYILDNSHVYITPMINPDGVDTDTRFNAHHVDLNRNYPYEWTAEDSIWGGHGSSPGSEPEVAANIAFMEKHEFDLHLTGHTGIVMLIYPWGYSRDPSPDDALFKTIEEDVEARWDIPTGQSAVILYPASGTAKDYGYGINHAPSWTFEVDDQQFVPVSGEEISERLTPIFECYMFLMKEAISGKWKPQPNVVDAWATDEDGDGFTFQMLVNNTGYTNITNGTATIELGGKSFSSLFSVGQFNETQVNINVRGDWSGKKDVLVRLDYRKLVLEDSKILTHEETVTIDIEESDGLPGFAGGDIILVLVITFFVVSLGKEGRRKSLPKTNPE